MTTCQTVGAANPVTPKQLALMGFEKFEEDGMTLYHRSMGELGTLHISLPDYLCLVSVSGEAIDFPAKMLTAAKLNSFINIYSTESNAGNKHNRNSSKESTQPRSQARRATGFDRYRYVASHNKAWPSC